MQKVRILDPAKIAEALFVLGKDLLQREGEEKKERELVVSTAAKQLIRDYNLIPLGYHDLLDGRSYDLYRVGDWEFFANTWRSDYCLGFYEELSYSDKVAGALSVEQADEILLEYIKNKPTDKKPLPDTPILPLPRTARGYTDRLNGASGYLFKPNTRAFKRLKSDKRQAAAPNVVVASEKMMMPACKKKEIHKRLGLYQSGEKYADSAIEKVYFETILGFGFHGVEERKEDLWRAMRDVLGIDGFAAKTYFVLFQNLNNL